MHKVSNLGTLGYIMHKDPFGKKTWALLKQSDIRDAASLRQLQDSGRDKTHVQEMWIIREIWAHSEIQSELMPPLKLGSVYKVIMESRQDQAEVQGHWSIWCRIGTPFRLAGKHSTRNSPSPWCQGWDAVLMLRANAHLFPTEKPGGGRRVEWNHRITWVARDPQGS